MRVQCLSEIFPRVHWLLKSCFTIACTFAFSGLTALESNDPVPAKKDTTVYDFIFIGGKYQNQFNFVGRNFGQRIPFASGDIFYYTNFNLWLSYSAYQFADNSIPFQSAVAAGYSKDLTKKIDLTASYSQFLIPATEQIQSLQSIGMFQTTVGLDWNILYSTLQVQVLTYSSPDIFVTSQHSRYFQFNEKLFGKIKVSFQPAISVTLGTSRFYYSDDEALAARGITNLRALLRTGNLNNGGGTGGTGGTNGGGNPGQGQGQGQGNPGGGQGNPGGSTGGGTGGGTPVATDLEGNGNQIGFLNWEVAFPVSLQWGRFSFEWSSRYAHPLNVIEADPSRPTFIHGVDLYYQIPVKRKKKIRS